MRLSIHPSPIHPSSIQPTTHPLKDPLWLSSTTVCVAVSRSYLTLCDPMDSSPPGTTVHGALQARILEWIAISFSKGFSQPRDRILISSSSSLIGRFFNVWAIKKGSQLLLHSMLDLGDSEMIQSGFHVLPWSSNSSGGRWYMETDQLIQHGVCYMCMPTEHLQARRGSAGPLRSKILMKMLTFS